MISGSCLCGNVQISVKDAPTRLVSCNCTACHRYGALWWHSTVEMIEISAETPTIGYARGDHLLEFHHCPTCGCMTHWHSIDPENPDARAANMRMCDPADTADIPTRFFDGRDSWTFIEP